MGKVLSLMTKPIREFNIESRAHAAISKEKPTLAPRHKADELNYERLLKGIFLISNSEYHFSLSF